jgi:hypothetical protein
MAIILRVDVDKPYGNHTVLRKIASKMVEDFMPNFNLKIGYLSHLKEFIRYCNVKGVVGTFFHRICTLPDQDTLDLLQIGGHEIGLHLENSRNRDTFYNELNQIKSYTYLNVKSFSKHGSGVYKLGKYHYPKYEPELYKKWAIELGIRYPSGNGIPLKPEDLFSRDGYYENIFWIEPSYRSSRFNNLGDIIKIAKKNDIVVLIHPCNFLSDVATRKEFQNLVELAAVNNINWALFK